MGPSGIVPLFLGPAEMAILGIVLLVLIFGSKAPDMASRVGESVGKASREKQKVQDEIEDLKGTPEAVKEDLGIDEDIKEIEEGVEEIEEGIEDIEETADPDATIDDGDGGVDVTANDPRVGRDSE